jgi:ribonuclease D
MPSFDWIAEQSELEALVETLVHTEAYGLDTEFHRERTYRPELALVQIATQDRIALIDPLAVDVRPLARALRSDAVCVIHAASQDLEILQLECGVVPARLFDPQIAALFCGLGTSSLGKLVQHFLGVKLDKSSQLTNWNRRPLPERDLLYAAEDVAHLLALREVCTRTLEDRGRLAWAQEEIERQRSRDRSAAEPGQLWWKLRGKAKLSGRARGVAQELAAWREQMAAERNRPTRTILSDMALLSLAQRPPKDKAQLRGVRGFDAQRFKLTDELLDAVARGVALGPDDVCSPPKLSRLNHSADGVVSLCSAWLSQRAQEEGIDTSVLGTRDDLTALVLGEPSRLSQGWRWELVGRELQALKQGQAALWVDGTELRLVDRR